MGVGTWVRRRVLGLDVEPGPAVRQFSGPMPIEHMFAQMRGVSRSLSRRDALSIPGVAKGRNLLCSVATLPIIERGPGNVTSRAPLLEQIDPNMANVVTLALTFEDLLFDAVSWWRVLERGADGYPTKATRLAPGSVTTKPAQGAMWPNPVATPGGVDPTATVVYVDGREVSRRDVIRFDSPNPGLNEIAGETFRLAADYRDAAAMYARNPQVSEFFSPADGVAELDDDAIREHLAAWLANRRRGGIGYVPAALKYNESSAPTAADMKLPELKQQAALETALTMGLDPEVLGVPTTSRTYANAQDWRRDRINDVLSAYMLAVVQRLSMPDLCRRGYVRTHDLDDYMKADPITRWTVYEKGIAMRAYGVEHVQAEEGLPMTGPAAVPAAPTGGTPAVTPGPSPAPAADPADELAARRGRAATFAAPPERTFEFVAARFSVDVPTRTIRGVALPYGEIASKYGETFRFQPGAIEWDAANVSRVKLLDSHDYARPMGVATELRNTPAALEASFRVGAGAERDALLADAADGIVDGLSVGVTFDMAADTVPDPDNPGVLLVRRATLNEVSSTAMPAFTGARVTTVAATRDNGGTMHPCSTCGAPLQLGVAHTCATPAPAPAAMTTEQFQAALVAAFPALAAQAPADPGPAVVDPAGPAGGATAATAVNEPLPYRFVRARPGRPAQFLAGEHDFSTDVVNMIKQGDSEGRHTEEGRRAMAFIAAEFDVDSADINEVTPEIQRPDMYVDQRDYKYPLWNFVNKGAPPNGIQPFRFPKFNAASGLVGAHTEGTEPTGGTLTTTSQPVTPDGLSGKAYLTREVWDMGGNPAVSGLIWAQMVRGYKEALEAAVATFLNTLTAATDLLITAGATDETLAASWEGHVADLQFVRGYDFSAFALEKELFKRFAAARDASERPLYPMLNPMNANGTVSSRFARMNLAGVEGVPSWALASTAGSPNNSWLFDPSTVHGWATQPQKLEFDGAADDNTTVAPVAKVGIGIWGYKAFANSDIGGVRQVIYDTTA